MIKSFTTRIKKLRANLNFFRTLRLVFFAARMMTWLSLFLIFLESILFFASMYLLKLLIDAISKNKQDGIQLITTYVIAAGLVSVIYVTVKAISNYITELQAAKVTE